jgi:antitoxin ChpS
MATVSLRKQGGAVVMTVPTEIVKKLDIAAGDVLDVSVVGGALVARPAGKVRDGDFQLAERHQGRRGV